MLVSLGKASRLRFCARVAREEHIAFERDAGIVVVSGRDLRFAGARIGRFCSWMLKARRPCASKSGRLGLRQAMHWSFTRSAPVRSVKPMCRPGASGRGDRLDSNSVLWQLQSANYRGTIRHICSEHFEIPESHRSIPTFAFQLRTRVTVWLPLFEACCRRFKTTGPDLSVLENAYPPTYT